MRRLLVLAGLLLGGTWTASAGEPHIDVEVRTTAGGIRAEFKLDRPVTELEFEYSSDADQSGSWIFSPDDLQLSQGRVRAADGRTFQQFSIDIAPAHSPGAPIYPPLVMLGDNGVVLYLPYLIARGAKTDLRFSLAADQVILGPPGGLATWTVSPRPARGAWPAERYSYIGPSAYIVDNGDELYVIPPETPEWMRSTIQSTTHRALAFYAKAVGELRQRTIVMVSNWNDEKRAGSSDKVSNLGGDVTEGGFILLRFEGGGWRTRTDWTAERLDDAMAHEVAHLWNGRLNSDREQKRTHAWLHEGGAEYWARLFLEPDADARSREMVDELNLCSASLGDKGLDGARYLGSGNYACGEVLQWLVDLGVRRRSKNRQTVLDVWRTLFDFEEAPKRIYDSRDFLRAAYDAAPWSRKPMERILHPGGIKRWHGLAADLKALGVALVEGKQPSIRPRRYLLRHLLTLDCGETTPRGLNDTATEAVLDTGDRCGVLSGNPRVTHAEGLSLFTEAERALRAVERKCKKSGVVTLTTKAAPGFVKLKCAKPLPPLPPYFQVGPASQKR